MGRIRSIKPEFFKHEELFNAEKETKLPLRVAFAGLWCAADREGCFKWKPNALKLDILPYDSVDFSRVLDALTTRGFLEKYENGGNIYGVIPSFLEHQVINNREAASTIPRVGHASSTRLSPAQGEGKGKERKGKEGEEEGRVAVFEKWNAWAEENKMVKISKLTDKRREKLNTRLSEKMFAIDQILETAGKSKFITSSDWFSFDWLIDNDTNYVKVLEGKYRDKSESNQTLFQPQDKHFD